MIVKTHRLPSGTTWSHRQVTPMDLEQVGGGSLDLAKRVTQGFDGVDWVEGSAWPLRSRDDAAVGIIIGREVEGDPAAEAESLRRMKDSDAAAGPYLTWVVLPSSWDLEADPEDTEDGYPEPAHADPFVRVLLEEPESGKWAEALGRFRATGGDLAGMAAEAADAEARRRYLRARIYLLRNHVRAIETNGHRADVGAMDLTKIPFSIRDLFVLLTAMDVLTTCGENDIEEITPQGNPPGADAT